MVDNMDSKLLLSLDEVTEKRASVARMQSIVYVETGVDVESKMS